MLDDDEWPEMREALTQGIRNVQAWRASHGKGLSEALEGDRLMTHYGEALDLYERLTGVRETDPQVLWHRRTSKYGPPCTACGKPLRTPRAKLCAACGTRREW